MCSVSHITDYLNIDVFQMSFINKWRGRVRGIRSSPQRIELFHKYCLKFNLPQKMLVLDVETRWNATLKMLKRIVEYQRPFLATINQTKGLAKYRIGEYSDEWAKARDMVTLLEPFEEAAKLLCQGHSPTISDTAAVFNFMFEHLENYTSSKSEGRLQRVNNNTNHAKWLKEAAHAGWEKLDKYYTCNDNLVHVVGTGKLDDPLYLIILVLFPLVSSFSYFSDGSKVQALLVQNLLGKVIL